MTHPMLSFPRLNWLPRAALLLLVCATAARADVYQWEWVDPGDPDQGKIPSSTPCPDGVGVSAVPYTDLSNRDLTQAYLIDANLRGAGLNTTNLTNADLSRANISNADLNNSTLNNANFNDANLTNAKFQNSTLTDADFSGATVAKADFFGTGLTSAQLYSTVSYVDKDLHGIKLGTVDVSNWNLAGQDLTRASFYAGTLTNANFTGAMVAARTSTAAQFDLRPAFQHGQLPGTGSPRHHPQRHRFRGCQSRWLEPVQSESRRGRSFLFHHDRHGLCRR